MNNYKKGEIITALTIAGVILLTVATFVSTFFLSKTKQTTSSKAAPNCLFHIEADAYADPSGDGGRDFNNHVIFYPDGQVGGDIVLYNNGNFVAGPNGWNGQGPFDYNPQWTNPGGGPIHLTKGGSFTVTYHGEVRRCAPGVVSSDITCTITVDSNGNPSISGDKCNAKNFSGGGVTNTPGPTSPPGCGKVCIYSQVDPDGVTRCYSGNCLDRSQNCSFNVNCGWISSCSSGRPVTCPGAPTNTPAPSQPTNTPMPYATNTPTPQATPTTIPGCNNNSCNNSNSYCVSTCGTGWYCSNGSLCQLAPTSTPPPTTTLTPIPSSTLPPNTLTLTPVTTAIPTPKPPAGCIANIHPTNCTNPKAMANVSAINYSMRCINPQPDGSCPANRSSYQYYTDPNCQIPASLPDDVTNCDTRMFKLNVHLTLTFKTIPNYDPSGTIVISADKGSILPGSLEHAGGLFQDNQLDFFTNVYNVSNGFSHDFTFEHVTYSDLNYWVNPSQRNTGNTYRIYVAYSEKNIGNIGVTIKGYYFPLFPSYTIGNTDLSQTININVLVVPN